MKTLPVSPDLSHLKKQAKQLLREAHAGEASAVERFIESLPGARAVPLAALAAHELKLNDAQSVIAREYGFLSWTELKGFVEWKSVDRAERMKTWTEWVYDGGQRERRLALRMLAEEPEFFAGDVWAACARGDAEVLREALAADAAWAKCTGGPRVMQPLLAVTHSMLMLEEGFEAGLLECARLLMEQGADVNATWTDTRYPEWPLSALYGAAGKTHSAAMTKLLVDAGANMDDNESLYHSVEEADSTCTRILLEAGVRVKGTNAIARAIDYGKVEDVRLMLAHGGDAKEGTPLHHAVLRGSSMEMMELLAQAGADLRAEKHGVSLWRFAAMFGRTDVLELLKLHGVEDVLNAKDEFVAACARADEAAARAMLEREPALLPDLGELYLRMMPELAAVGQLDSVRTMLKLGWPLEVKTGWKTTALNLAVYRGDRAMTELLMQYGADWRTMHGYGSNVMGTLSHASQNDPEDPLAPLDFVGCARVLIEYGMPLPDSEAFSFSPEVTEYFDALRLTRS